MASGVKAGSAYVEVSIDDAKVKAGLRSLSVTMDTWSRKAAAIGMGAMVAATAAAVPVLSSMSVFANFESQMSKVAAITQATSAQIKELRDQAIELGKTTFFTTSQVADAQKFLGMAGFDPQQIKAATPAVLDLALAGDMDLGTAADIATNISTPFKIAAEDLTRVNDVLARAANSSNTNVMEMGQAFKYAAPAASAAGQSLEECGAAMAILANNGLKADMAGTSIRMMLIKLADSGIQKKLREQFDIEVTDPTGKMRPLMTILQDIKAATGSMGDTEAMGVFFDIFEARAGSAALVLGNAGDAVTDFREKMIESAGTAAAMAKTMADNIKGDWIALTSAAEGVQIAVGDAFNDLGRDFLQWATMATRGVAVWVQENKSLVSGAGLAVAALGGFGAAALTVSGVMRGLSAVSGMLATSKTVEYFGGVSSAARLAAADYGNMGAATTKLLGILGLQKTQQTGTAAAILLMSNAEVAARRAGSTALNAYSVANLRVAATEKVKTAASLVSSGITKGLIAVKTGATAAVSGLTMANIANAGSSTLAAMKNAYLALTTKGIAVGYLAATVAAKGFSAAIYAIPGWGWALAGIAAVSALSYSFASAKKHSAELSDEMSKKRETGDATRNVDQLRMDRLKQLASLEKLSNSELNEAESLVSKLGGRYGDLGISIDKMAGKLNMAGDAMERFISAMNANALRDLEDELREAQKNIDELEKERSSISKSREFSLKLDSTFGDNWDLALHDITLGLFGEKASDHTKRLLEENDQKLKEQKEKAEDYQRRIAAISGGENAIDVARGEGATLQDSIANFQADPAAAKESENAEKKLADIRRTLERERRSQLENEIADVKELNQTYKALLETLLQAERAKLETETDEGKREESEGKIAEWELLLNTADATERDRIDRLIEKLDLKPASFEIGERQSALADARLGLQNARDTGGDVEAWQKKVDDAKFELETAQIAQAGTELKEAGEKFQEAVEAYENAKQGGDKEKIAVAAVKANEARGKLDSAGSRYESLVGNESGKPLTEKDMAVSGARSELGQALLRLAAANQAGDTTKIQAVEIEVKEAKSSLQKAELAVIEEALVKAQQESVEALARYETAKSGGSVAEVRRAEAGVVATQQTAGRAQTDYQSMIENMKRGAEASRQSFSVAGTFNAAAARSMGGVSHQAKMLSLTERIANNTDPKKKERDKNETETETSPESKNVPVEQATESVEMVNMNKNQTEYLRVIADKARNSNGIIFT